MRKIIIAIAALLGVLVVAALVAPFLIPLDWVKDKAVAQVEAATGRTLTIGGDVGLSILPNVQVEVSDVRFSNRPGSDVADMATLSDLRLDVALMPLLSGELVINEFVLIDPVIQLETDALGTGNWEMMGATGTDTQASSGSGETTGEGSGPATGQLNELRLGDVRIENGRVTYHDGQTGETTELSEFNVTLSLPGLDSPFEGKGSLVYKGQEVDLDTGVGSLRALMEGQSTNARVALESAPMTASFDGDVSKGGTLDGRVELSIASLRGLAGWLATPLAENSPAPETVTVTGQLALAGDTIAFTGAQIAADALKASGDLGVDLSGARPAISAQLTSDMLDLNPYLPQTQSEQAAAESGSGGSGESAGEGAAAEGWSDEAIDFSGLDLADADLSFTLAGLKVRAIEIGQSTLNIVVQNGSARLDLVEAQLYGGSGSADIAIDRSADRPAISADIAVKGIAAEPLLTAAAGFDKLSGTGDIALDVTTTGDSQRRLVENLAGNGAVLFRDGAFKGVDLAAMARDVSLDSVIGAASGGGSTDFAELSATFAITDGVARNDDLFLAAPLLRAAGKGNVNMPPRTLDYTLFLKPVANLEGQGASADEAGGGIPILVRGPWSDLSYEPDMEALAKGLLSDPDALGETLQNLGGGDGESGGGLLESLGGEGGDAADAIKGLFD
ncbi:MAG: AsmA family protein [Proteobacteria bacterium]|nr:AsmA family protein [Pseudomonadota bacterium]MDA0952326.1 AsmA family protein [Pseudomonadota bacterium]MDA1072385.1 AsmA family protein [Pseudomonadota bacterium]